MELPILIAKKEKIKIRPDDYKVGWLMKDKLRGVWLVWGSFKDLNTALKCVKDTIKEKGKREIYLSSIPLDKHLTLNQIVNLENITASFK